ncbi:MAG TPA: neutral/alkaline non-lysosomal ceramidase N-terminal domain-containing protein [Anaerolineales bacterium]|nr:neutral/alkaline non-lysosomal ceramidase N-terminal domain-containing protein [Anaerolineales bacterium]
MPLAIGYVHRVITPALDRPVYLAGFGQNRVAQSVHDDLYVRALALTLGETRLVLTALDLLGLARAHCLEIEQRVNQTWPRTRVILASTHTHHGPDPIGLWGPDQTTSGVDPAYISAVKDQAVSTIVAACGQTQPADLRAASARVPGVAKNARDPEIVDDELTGLQFCAPDTGKALATLLIFPCHPEVLWEHNPHITSDYPHVLRREIEAATGAPCLFFSGALGGMMTPDVKEHSFDEAEVMGRALAQAALRMLATGPVEPVEALAHYRREYAVPMTNPLFHRAMEAGLLPNTMTTEGVVRTEANLLKIGPAWLAAVPGELLPKLGLELKADLGRAGARVAAVIGLANDELGYILPPEVFAYPENPFEPGDHYEETMSIGPEAGPRLMGAMHFLIETADAR